ncbi:hypothetical protein [Gemmiger sp.]|nr:hypothetical protein [Gemmiger sp.]MDY5604353.1 hypothetical protein [Gemmiger sp.]
MNEEQKLMEPNASEMKVMTFLWNVDKRCLYRLWKMCAAVPIE